MPDNDQQDYDTPETAEAANHVIADLEQLRTKAAERDTFHELLLRTRADFDNYQKRAHRDMQEERRYALRPLVLDLLPALDNLERALTAVKEESPLSKGVAIVQTQLVEALKRHGVTRLEPKNVPFDPHNHEAVMQQPAPGQPANTVLQTLEPGYMYHDRVLRPAKVIVSKSE